jgi:hypothetical protein
MKTKGLTTLPVIPPSRNQRCAEVLVSHGRPPRVATSFHIRSIIAIRGVRVKSGL